ncbi:hypothetical protein [Fundidesulfovibrio magnetotacticus]|uniref:hypothetical protein n=1 Tax=Fundidesulfovibrio magnetotacticus TaxID=2730080 RepID=UPI001565378E|nr:hypothetical protein [Fundidesulfovibrio magnetotacticus]
MSEDTYLDSLPIFGWGPIRKRLAYLGVFLFLCTVYAVNSDYNFATGSGNLSMVLFLAANVYFPVKRIVLHYRLKGTQEIMRQLLIYHIWLNTFSFLAACVHCYVALWGNFWLMVALSLMGFLTFFGFLMWIKYQPNRMKKGIYILHTQQFLFFIMIFAMLKGHYVV